MKQTVHEVLVSGRDAARSAVGATDAESPFRLLAETIPSIAWTADAAGRINYINERFHQYTGVPIGTGQDRWPAGTVHPEDRERAARAWKHSLQTGEDHLNESRIRRRDGMYRWFEAHAVPHRDASGRIVQWFGATTDIDDRKRAEEVAAFMSRASSELAQLSDYRETLVRIANFAIPAYADWCGIFLTDEAGNVQRLTLANQDPGKVRWLHEMRDRFPYRGEDPIGPGKVLRTGESCWSEYMSDAMLEGFSHNAEHLELLKRVNFRSWVCVPIRLQRRIRGAISFVMSDSGRVYKEAHLRVAEDLAHRVGIAIENNELVAELRQSDRQKTELLDALREEDRRKDEFLAVLAHELRNPLAPIRNSVFFLRAKSPPAPELQWAQDVIERQVQHMSRLVDDLLDVARVGKGKIELRRDRVSLAAAINGAVETCRPQVEGARHQLAVSMPMQALFVDADLTRLSQVFSNLINNAAKYMDAGGRIRVDVERQGDEAVVCVCDTGIGIAPEMITKIFEAFTQVDRSLDRSQGGLGIGLTLARRLVEMHGGSLTARSAGLGKGSEFEVRLPVLSEVRASARQFPGGEAPTPSGGGLRVLVVDDNQDAADTLGALLEAKGYAVRIAYDGIEGVGASLSFKPEVALLDIGLPRLYGHDLAREIRAQLGDKVLLIAITGLGQEEDRRRSKEAGFDHHFTKPVDLAAIERLISKVRAS